MPPPIISVENLGKSYLVGHPSSRREGYTALRDVVGRNLTNFGRKAWDMARGRPIVQGDKIEEFWALTNVSFDVQEGEVIGIIGRNGAGKSTLLKILSRITEPTTGRLTLRGRVASLLEVGTGFHPELTGRENIFLNGAILGMARSEIRRKFDEIVEFAGVESFLDTPVKRYSSGMYVRLAFAVAAHLDPEILVVDEVLAVGDAEFQKKCLGKMRNVSSQGRTVLLVSHNLSSISSLCDRTLFFDNGKLLSDGPTSGVILSYLSQSSTGIEFAESTATGDENGQLLQAWTETDLGERSTSFTLDQAVTIVMEYRVIQELPVAPHPNFHIYDERGQCAFVTSDRNDRARTPGIYRANCTIPRNLLNDGTYFIGVALTCSHAGIKVCFDERDSLAIHMREPISATVDGRPRFGYAGPMPGLVRPDLGWEISAIDPEIVPADATLQTKVL